MLAPCILLDTIESFCKKDIAFGILGLCFCHPSQPKGGLRPLTCLARHCVRLQLCNTSIYWITDTLRQKLCERNSYVMLRKILNSLS
jgi:hypothetical protein